MGKSQQQGVAIVEFALVLPFLIILLVVLAVITYVPTLTLWLPDAVLGR